MNTIASARSQSLDSIDFGGDDDDNDEDGGGGDGDGDKVSDSGNGTGSNESQYRKIMGYKIGSFTNNLQQASGNWSQALR